MKTVTLLGGRDGFGGLCKVFQCAFYVKQAGYVPEVYLSIKRESGELLKYLFKDQFDVTVVPETWTENDRVLYDHSILDKFIVEDFYYIYPDELYRNPYAFDFNRFNTNPKTIKSTRLLTHRLKQEDVIYVGLNTTTQGYDYKYVDSLIKSLSNTHYTIYVPLLDSWNNEKVKLKLESDTFPDNVKIDRNPNIIDSIKWLEKSKFCICADNGISHVSYHLGHRRILMDSRAVAGVQRYPWEVRWLEDTSDSVPINTQPSDITNLIKTLTIYPQNTISNYEIIENLGMNWNQALFLKQY